MSDALTCACRGAEVQQRLRSRTDPPGSSPRGSQCRACRQRRRRRCSFRAEHEVRGVDFGSLQRRRRSRLCWWVHGVTRLRRRHTARCSEDGQRCVCMHAWQTFVGGPRRIGRLAGVLAGFGWLTMTKAIFGLRRGIGKARRVDQASRPESESESELNLHSPSSG